MGYEKEVRRNRGTQRCNDAKSEKISQNWEIPGQLLSSLLPT
uniref:Uncharacterized protein n=1 Tax=Heterorhabditis bacteriophora TaxID=37862 RepID=A0A1I7WXA6_HETBA